MNKLHSKAAEIKFNQAVERLLLSLGAKPQTDGSHYKYTLDTKAGLLRLTTHEPEKSRVYSVYCKFEDGKKAAELLPHKMFIDRLSAHTGKWNFHTADADVLLWQLERELKPLLFNAPLETQSFRVPGLKSVVQFLYELKALP